MNTELEYGNLSNSLNGYRGHHVKLFAKSRSDSMLDAQKFGLLQLMLRELGDVKIAGYHSLINKFITLFNDYYAIGHPKDKTKLEVLSLTHESEQEEKEFIKKIIYRNQTSLDKVKASMAADHGDFVNMSENKESQYCKSSIKYWSKLLVSLESPDTPVINHTELYAAYMQFDKVEHATNKKNWYAHKNKKEDVWRIYEKVISETDCKKSRALAREIRAEGLKEADSTKKSASDTAFEVRLKSIRDLAAAHGYTESELYKIINSVRYQF